MLSAYRPLFAVPGAAQFMLGSVISRVGGAMFGVSVIVMVSSRHGSYATAGLVSAVGVVVLAVAGPFIGGFIDRHGQRSAARFAAVATFFALTCAFLSYRSAPVWAVALAYGLCAVVPEASTMSRARWAHVFEHEEGRLHAAMSFEQVLEEGSFVIGPVLAVAVSTLWFPEAGLVLATLFFFVGILVLVAERRTEPPIVPHADRPAGLAIHRRGMVVVAAVLTMVGVIFGSNEVLAVAVADHAGNKPFSSVLLGAFALGSSVSGVIFGGLAFRTPLSRRFLYAATAMFLLEVPALLTTSLWALALVLLVAGSATAPTLISAFTLAQRLVPKALITEGMAVAVTGILVGISIGTTLGGFAVEHMGAHAAYIVPVAAGAVAAAIALAAQRRISGADDPASVAA